MKVKNCTCGYRMVQTASSLPTIRRNNSKRMREGIETNTFGIIVVENIKASDLENFAPLGEFRPSNLVYVFILQASQYVFEYYLKTAAGKHGGSSPMTN